MREKINVLSLFDGISCGQIALSRLGIESNYYASEIDAHAIKITHKNFPNTIQIGDVTLIDTNKLPKIDLLIGGSPCQGFSFAGKQLNFSDPRSKLFFEYVRILKELQKSNPNVKFLLENVVMKKEFQDVISSYLGIEPILINSALVSAQNRKRLYWTNISVSVDIEDKNIQLKDILEVDYEFEMWIQKGYKKNNIKSNTITTKSSQSDAEWVVRKGSELELTERGALKVQSNARKLTPIEYERLQTIDDNYTEGISNTQRYKCLGNCWTVDVIVEFFKNLL